MHIHDLHATILHLLGLDHTRLTYHYGGRDFRLTDVAGEVVEGILAPIVGLQTRLSGAADVDIVRGTNKVDECPYLC